MARASVSGAVESRSDSEMSQTDCLVKKFFNQGCKISFKGVWCMNAEKLALVV